MPTLLFPVFHVVREQVPEEYRLHRAFSDYKIKTFSHFYHLGSTESLRNRMTEAPSRRMRTSILNALRRCRTVIRFAAWWTGGAASISWVRYQGHQRPVRDCPRQAVATYAVGADLMLAEPEKQNHYPDFTLMRGEADEEKIALDVKTTYRKRGPRFDYTLGSYTSYIRPETESKNIHYPYSEYREHWIIGFVYNRIEAKRSSGRIYSFDALRDIPTPSMT